MADENVRDDEVRVPEAKSSGRRWALVAVGLLLAFLLGLLPMWWSKMSVDAELEKARRDLIRQKIQNSLSAAAVYARRGEYETARQSASTFFTDTQAELDNAASTIFTPTERSQMPDLMSRRDDIITLVSRADPASAERLSDVYVNYRSITAAETPPVQ